MNREVVSSPKRVVVAMSGGVDSSVAAAMLVEKGYDVIGMMMRLWSEPGIGPARHLNRCCTPDQIADARRVANALGIPFYVLDVQDLFRRRVVQYFIDEHTVGRTPNPCIECNREIRFTYLLERAIALRADFLATGHYARVQKTAEGYQLLRAVDRSKDQSYVLHTLDQKTLSQVLFPVGDYEKVEIRALAHRLGLTPVAHKGESMDLCFLGDGDYRRFLSEYAKTGVSSGPIEGLDGAVLGQHNGLPYYTIGQRKGLGISAAEPLYVKGKDIDRNALIVAPRRALGETRLTVTRLNWIAGDPPPFPAKVEVKIRYRAKGVPAILIGEDAETLNVSLSEPVAGITPGQGAVFYDEELVLGGGIIHGTSGGNEDGPQSVRAEKAPVQA